MNEFLQNISNGILGLIEAVLNVLSAGDKVIEILDGVTFDETTQIYQFFSTFRYLLGDGLYLILTALIILGVSLLIFKLVKVSVNGILSFIPGFSIKLP